ncbi:MAG TPA: glycosyltransferase family 2 protein [Patescibacteria group bacterium]|nr:glycosyltransferase family 2 protein [Patescibacteria group bacterium]
MLTYHKVSIVVPVYNEKRYISTLITALQEAPVLDLKKEIILVDDCSKDGTREVLQGLPLQEGFKVIYRETNGGKGSALVDGFKVVTGDIVIVQDADMEYDPNEYPSLLEPFLEHNAEVVYGSRYLKGSLRQVPLFWHTIFNKLFTLLSNMLTNVYLTDEQTCYKVFNKKVLEEVALKIESKRFGFDPEFTVRMSRGKYKIMEVPVSYYPRTRAAGKHMNLRSQIDTLITLLKYSWKLRHDRLR